MAVGKARRAAALLLAAACFALCPAAARAAYDPGAGAAYAEGIYGQRLAQVQLTGDYCTDIVSVALSQVGYHEGSDRAGYSGTEYEGCRNYTEYGISFGLDASWCAMFISWCARRAEIPSSVLNNATMAVAGSGRMCFHIPYYSRGTCVPKSGDLIFFYHSDYHVGIVVETAADRIVTVEGNSANAVRTDVYSPDDPAIRGYGVYADSPADPAAIPYGSDQLISISEPSLDGEFGLWPDGEAYYSCSRYWALMNREVCIPRDLYVRSGYSLAGWYLYRSDDDKWLTDSGWQTGRGAAEKKCAMTLLQNGGATVPDASWRDGCEDAADFVLCAVWKNSGDGSLCVDAGAPFCGRIDSSGWFCPVCDIGENDWYYAAAKYVLQDGIFSGTTRWRFSPGDRLTRGMLACVLYKLADSPSSRGSRAPFRMWRQVPGITTPWNGRPRTT